MNNNQLLPYIHLVVDRLMNLGGADYDSDKAASPEDKSKGLIARDFGIEEWDWPQGVGLYGLLKLQNFYGDGRYLDFLKNWYDSNLKKGLPSRNINTTAPYLTLAYLLDVLDNPEYEELCIRQARWLMTEMPRTPEGGFQHVTSAIGDRNGVILNDGELWIDTLFMAVLFLNKMGQRCGEKEWVSESIHQVLLHIKYLYEKKTGLFYHGFSFPLNSNFGGIFWCRGNSWFTVGIMDYLETFRGRLDAGLSAYLVDTYKAQVRALKELQAPSGLWHTVLTDPASYEEVSGSAAIAAGILKGLKLGILDETYRPCAQNAVEAICQNIGEDGTVKNVSAGTGMGYDAQHYKDIAIMPMAYGQSLALLALCEALD
ncbi:MAG: glycoside hydrolase family 88 protein [Hungatella hathewayi]|nr:glycoside hydrolase family 88 protein [Hungatella hathewayi]